MSRQPSAAEIQERKARLLRESEACRANLVHSKEVITQQLGGGSLFRGALRIAGLTGSPLAGSGVRILRSVAPAALSWVMGKQLRRPALIAVSVASLALVWAKSSSARKRKGSANERAESAEV